MEEEFYITFEEARKITYLDFAKPEYASELADIPESGWQNPTVDVREYIQTCSKVWRVPQSVYERAKKCGLLVNSVKVNGNMVYYVGE